MKSSQNFLISLKRAEVSALHPPCLIMLDWFLLNSANLSLVELPKRGGDSSRVQKKFGGGVAKKIWSDG